jgi:putative transposase
MELPQRHTPAHPPPLMRHNRAMILFLTVCTDKRKRILACDEAHHLLLDVWRESNEWQAGRYVVMPDHIHLFCAPVSLDSATLSRWVTFWKSRVSQRWHRPDEQPIWQRSYWDTQLRREENYDAKWEYVRCNPVRQRLVSRAEDWLYQGELNVLDWHD